MNTSNYIKHVQSNKAQKYLLKRFNQRLLNLIEIADPNSILDVGCGEGFTLSYIKKNCPNINLVGVDNSNVALQIGRKLFKNLKFSKGSAYNLDFKNNSFDMVICSEVLEHLENYNKALSEIIRVSKGNILLSVPLEPWFQIANLLRGKYSTNFGNHPEHINHWTRSKFTALLRSKNLQILSAEILFPWILVFARK